MAQTNVFISFSFEASEDKKNKLTKKLQESNYASDYSEKTDYSGFSESYIWKKLKDRIAGASVLVLLYSKDMERGFGGKALKKYDGASPYKTSFEQQGWVYKELRAALKHGVNNHMNGIVVVMPDDVLSRMRSSSKSGCGIDVINTDLSSYPPILKNNFANKKVPYRKDKCDCHFDLIEDSYIPIVKESLFMRNPSYYIEKVKAKRGEEYMYEIKKGN